MNLFLKRFFDIIFSLILAVAFLPVWVIISAIIKVDSKGPVFFLQDRRTKNGRIFKMIKFRSMVPDAEKTGAGLFNYENDPRVTKVGLFLRNTSLDELPQIFNVLKGDMSFVGPRPCVSYELGDFDTLNRRYKKRFEVKAGITGLAQVSGRNNISWDDKVEFDNRYVDLFNKKGVLVDLKILFLTFSRVFKRENIYEGKADENVSDRESAELENERIILMAHAPDTDVTKV